MTQVGRRSRYLARVVAVLLFALVIAILISPARSFGPSAPETESLVHVFFVGWAVIGLGLVWGTRSRVTELVALVVFSGGAVLGTLLTPAVVGVILR